MDHVAVGQLVGVRAWPEQSGIAAPDRHGPLRRHRHPVVEMRSATATCAAVDQRRSLRRSGRSDIEEAVVVVVIVGIDLNGLRLAGSGGLIRLDGLGQVEEQELLRLGSVVGRGHWARLRRWTVETDGEIEKRQRPNTQIQLAYLTYYRRIPEL